MVIKVIRAVVAVAHRANQARAVETLSRALPAASDNGASLSPRASGSARVTTDRATGR